MELGLSLGLGRREEEDEEEERSSSDLQLSLLPFTHENKESSRGLDVNIYIPSSTSEAEDGTARAVSGSPNSDEDENPNSRKKLRLSKEQSAFLEESFKEHTTLNPKQKLALAKQLNLRPRQVEVWFQNRRARTKLKQTEVDCEYLKRCCETLTEENRRLQKELSELRALKAPSHPFSMQLPATTLSMCPSCERTIATTTAPNAASASSGNQNNKANNASFGSLLAASKPRIYPFAPRPATSPAS